MLHYIQYITCILYKIYHHLFEYVRFRNRRENRNKFRERKRAQGRKPVTFHTVSKQLNAFRRRSMRSEEDSGRPSNTFPVSRQLQTEAILKAFMWNLKWKLSCLLFNRRQTKCSTVCELILSKVSFLKNASHQEVNTHLKGFRMHTKSVLWPWLIPENANPHSKKLSPISINKVKGKWAINELNLGVLWLLQIDERKTTATQG